jgi:Peptidase family M28
MRSTACLLVMCAALLQAQSPAQTPAPVAAAPAPEDPIRTLVSQLDLEKYKTTIKGLTQFGDRREGTERNRKAVDWIETQLKSYSCETGRISYDPANARGLTDEEIEGQRAGRAGGRGAGQGQAQGRGRGQGAGRGEGRGTPEDPFRRGAGGKGFGARTGVNNDAERQPDVKLRELNRGPVIPGPVDMVYCTKWGTTRRGEMYIVGAHMDGIGYGEAANDDGSGTALVMELARIFSAPEVTTDVTIRFALWNGEEGGLKGANAYVAQRQKLQGTPAEPKWLGMVQHDMMMWDHGMPGPDGRISPWQRPEADVNIEFQETSKTAAESHKFALAFKSANERYATDYPATVGSHMQSTDSVPFQDIVPAISLRENERRDHIGFGWDPNWHQVTDVFSTYTDKDFKLGLNAAQTTLAAIGQLSGAKIKK